MNDYDELNELRFLYACASIKVAMSTFLEICEDCGCVSDALLESFDEARKAISALAEP